MYSKVNILYYMNALAIEKGLCVHNFVNNIFGSEHPCHLVVQGILDFYYAKMWIIKAFTGKLKKVLFKAWFPESAYKSYFNWWLHQNNLLNSSLPAYRRSKPKSFMLSIVAPKYSEIFSRCYVFHCCTVRFWIHE